MKDLIFLLTILLIGCSTPKSSPNKDEVALTNLDSLRVDPPIINFDKDIEVRMNCKIYQYSDNDSINKKVAKTITFYSSAEIASETYNNYKKTTNIRSSDATYFYDYKDNLLVQKRSITDKKDSTKTIMVYNQKNQLTKEVHYNYKRRQHPDINKGIGQPGGCIVTDEDYEMKQTWAIKSIIHFKYDSLGRKTEYYAPSVHLGNQNRYTWKYNGQGQIQEHRSYDHDRLIWVEAFSYTDTSYQYTRTWFNNNGSPKHLNKKSWEYTSQITCAFSLDEQKRVIEEAITTEKGEYRGRTTTDYNNDGLMAKTVKYDLDDNPEMTHVYKYKK